MAVLDGGILQNVGTPAEPAAGPNRQSSLSGEIASSESPGEFSRCAVRAGGTIVTADQQHFAGRPLFAVGSAIRLGVPAEQVWCF